MIGQVVLMAELLSLRKGSAALGIALSTLQHHVKRGNVRLFDGKVDVDVARIQLARNADPEQSMRGRQNGGADGHGSVGGGGSGGAAGGPGSGHGSTGGSGVWGAGDKSGGLWGAKEHTEGLRGKLLEIELAEKEGKLVDGDVVRRATMNKARIARDALLSLPTRVSAELAAESDAGKVHDRLVAEIRTICAELAAGEDTQTSQ
jgi:hypothetical protein